MREDVALAREHHQTRMALYASHGYDRRASVRFVVDQAGPIDGPVLDVGSGQGLLAMELARRGHDVYSVDPSEQEQQLAIANAEIDGVLTDLHFALADARRLPFPDRFFGSAATLDVLHHLEEGPPVFGEMLRVVRPGGTIVVAEFDAEGFALVARVHATEGRVHPEGPVTFDAAVGWLIDRGMTLQSKVEGSLHVVAVLRRP